MATVDPTKTDTNTRGVSRETAIEDLRSTIAALLHVASLVSVLKRAAERDADEEDLDTQNICDAIMERLGPTYEALEHAIALLANGADVDEEGRRVPVATPFPVCRLDPGARYEILARLRRISDATRELGDAEEHHAAAAIEACAQTTVAAVREIEDHCSRPGVFEDELVPIDTLACILRGVDLDKINNAEGGLTSGYAEIMRRQVGRAVNALHAQHGRRSGGGPDSREKLADLVHDRNSEARALLEVHDLDEADMDALRHAAHCTSAALEAVKSAIHTLPHDVDEPAPATSSGEDAAVPGTDAPRDHAGDVEHRPLYLDVGEDRECYDGGLADLTLNFERIDTLMTAIVDVVMSGEERNLVSLVSMVRHYLRDADRICTAKSKRWDD